MCQARAEARRERVPRQPRFRARALIAVFAGSLCAAPADLHSQLERLPEQGGRTHSLGQPPRTHYFTGFSGGTVRNAPAERQLAAYALLGVQRPLLNPVAGLASVGFELYGGVRGDAADGGVRGILRIPYIGMGRASTTTSAMATSPPCSPRSAPCVAAVSSHRAGCCASTSIRSTAALRWACRCRSGTA